MYVITGRGATASATARMLADQGTRVRMISRSGGGPDHARIERISADATDTERLTELTRGATTLINCAAPAYHLWPDEFPTLAASLLNAVRRTGVSYVMLGNLYGYGLVDGPVHPHLPLAATGPKGRTRANVFREALASGLPVTEVRAAQFYGKGAYSVFNLMIQPHVSSGTLALAPQEIDMPHSYSAIEDTARTLIAVSREEQAFGRAWHAPAVTPTLRELASRFAALAGAPEPRLERLTERDISLLALTNPFWYEMLEPLHAPGLPYVSDFSDTTEVLGLHATPIDAVLSDQLPDQP